MNNPETFYCDPAKVPYREKNSNQNSLPWIDEDLRSMLLQFAESSFWVNLVSNKKKSQKATFCNKILQPVKTGHVARQVWSWKVIVERSTTSPFIQLVLQQAAKQVALFCYNVVLVSQAKGLANFTINCILYVYKHLKKLLTYVTSHTKMFLTVCRFRTDSHIYLTHAVNLFHLMETRNTQHIAASCSKIS